MPKKQNKTHLVSHTHWDAEWYFTTGDTDSLLVNHIDDLLNKINKVSYPFHFDGQVYPIKRFLDFSNPNQAKKLLEGIKKGKIQIGPWFSQPTARQIHQENYYRNLEHGVWWTKNINNENTGVALMSDIFGFNRQTAQILNNHNLNSFFFMRGHDKDLTEGSNEFIYQAPNGDSVFAKAFQTGYGNAKFMTPDDVEDYIATAKLDAKNNKSKISLLMHGGDQMFMRDNLPEIAAAASKKDENSDWEVSSLAKYVETVKSKINIDKLPKYEGELICTKTNRIHLSAYPHRQDVNHAITETEFKLVNVLEPLNVLSVKMGGVDYQAFIYEVWRDLFLSTAHDAAAGCNSDETNASILSRMEIALNKVNSTINLLKKNIGLNLLKENELFIFNSHLKDNHIFGEYEIASNFPEIELISENKIYSRIIATEEKTKGELSKPDKNGNQKTIHTKYYLHKVIMDVGNVKAFDIVKINVKEKANQSKNETCKNDLLDDTSFKGMKIKVIANAGDSYDFSPAEMPTATTTINLNDLRLSAENNIVTGEINVNINAFEDMLVQKKKVKQSLKLFVVKYPNGQIRFSGETNNKIKNALVQITLEAKDEIRECKSRTVFYDETFVNQKVKDWREEHKEYPSDIFPFNGFIKSNGNLILSKWFKEYSYEGHELNISLYRTGDMLGKDNLAWRPGRASGVNDQLIMTPDAQLLGKKIDIGFAIDLNTEEANKKLSNYASGMITYQRQPLAKHLERAERFNSPFIKLTNELPKISVNGEAEISSLYINEEGKTVIRLFNNSSKNSKVEVQFNNKNKEYNLNKFEIKTLVENEEI